MHFSTLRKENESRGGSLTRKSSRSRLHEDDWKIHNNGKRANPKPNKQVFSKTATGALTKFTMAEQRSISSNGVFGSSTTRIRKRTVLNLPVNISKPNYKWVPKSIIAQSSSSSENVSDVKSQKQNDKSVNIKDRPRTIMTWVPKTK